MAKNILLTERETAKILKVHIRTVKRYVDLGYLKANTLADRRLIRIPLNQPFFTKLGITFADLLENNVEGDDNE
jgi:hypothetical protein